jgi:hypothetical protein
MSTVAKVFVVLNLVLAVAFLGAAATFLAYVDSYRGQLDVEKAAHVQTRTDKDRQIADLTTQLGAATQQVLAANTARDLALATDTRTTQAWQNLQADYANTAANLTRATASLTVAQDTIKNLTALKDELQQNARTMNEAMRVANDERGAAVKAANQAQLDLENSQSTVRELEQKLATCEDARARLDFAQRARAAGGGTGGPGEPQPAQAGKITAADPRANIVVISLGSEDGVKAGFRYVVSRGAAYVGTVEVTSTEAKQSAARSLRDLQKSEIRTGDDVMSR